jgi:hypothetical protein
MTALEEVKKLEETVDASNQELLFALAKEGTVESLGKLKAAFEGRTTPVGNQDFLVALVEELSIHFDALRDRLLDNSNSFVALYWYALGVTRDMKSSEVAVEVWKVTWDCFTTRLKAWEDFNLPEIPEFPKIYEFAGVVGHLRKVLRDLATKAEQEYRSYKETAFLLSSPENAQRLNEALEQANKGEVTRHSSVAEFIKSTRGKVQD